MDLDEWCSSVHSTVTLYKFDLEFIRNNAKSVISPIIITNSDQTESISLDDVKAVIKGESCRCDNELMKDHSFYQFALTART